MILHFGRQRREKWFYVATRRCKWMCEDESFLCCCWSITSLSTNVEQRWMIYGGRGEENTSSSSSTTLFRSWSMTLWRRLAKNSRLIAQRLKFQRRKKYHHHQEEVSEWKFLLFGVGLHDSPISASLQGISKKKSLRSFDWIYCCEWNARLPRVLHALPAPLCECLEFQANRLLFFRGPFNA